MCGAFFLFTFLGFGVECEDGSISLCLPAYFRGLLGFPGGIGGPIMGCFFFLILVTTVILPRNHCALERLVLYAPVRIYPLCCLLRPPFDQLLSNNTRSRVIKYWSLRGRPLTSPPSLLLPHFFKSCARLATFCVSYNLPSFFSTPPFVRPVFGVIPAAVSRVSPGIFILPCTVTPQPI